MQQPEDSLRVALLTHSVNPRGAVVHALELGEALTQAGHDVTVFAPGRQGQGFFRRSICRTQVVPTQEPARPGEAVPLAGLLAGPQGPLRALVRQRIADYVDWFEREGCGGWDVFHAQDSISANALATLTERGRLAGFVRTVHHLDRFDDPLLMEWQTRGFLRAHRVLCVSEGWRARLRADHGIAAEVVGNGVDPLRFSPLPQAGDAALRSRLGLFAGWKDGADGWQSSCEGGAAPLFLAVGGVEPRKNTMGILQAFTLLKRRWPNAQLVIAGGASLLDHGGYQAAFDELLRASGLAVGPGRSVVLAGPVADGEAAALMRLADVMLFPSVQEGFGLVLLESLSCGTPVVTSRIAPFTEYLQPDDVAWADPQDAISIADAACTLLAQLSEPAAALRLRRRAQATAARFPWSDCARRHELVYRDWLAAPRRTPAQPEQAHA